MNRDETLGAAPDEFVLRIGAAPDEALARARRLGAVEALESAPQLRLLRVRGAVGAKEAWQSAARELGAATPLFPVLYDRDKVAHYPTGEVTVRFEATPTDAQLRRFCDRQRLRLLRRNEFVAQQVVCEATAPASEFLPDLVARLAAQPSVRAAWANTLSRYRRAGT